MLVNLNDVLLPAQKGGYGVGLFNTVNAELAAGVFAAAEAARSPVIVGTAEVLLPFGGLEELSYLLLPMAKRASVPVVLHFDHGTTMDATVKAIELGFSSVMFDRSDRPFEENMKEVKELTDYAHKKGVTVEVPLVLHGGSGLSDEQFRECIRRDICKVNIFTDINKAAPWAGFGAAPQKLTPPWLRSKGSGRCGYLRRSR